jgi:hypothetical protein
MLDNRGKTVKHCENLNMSDFFKFIDYLFTYLRKMSHIQLPISLVMRSTKCFYCPCEFSNDYPVLGYNHGIRYCEKHFKEAQRDGKAFLHTIGKVNLSDALVHPLLSRLIERLSVPVVILRSNGTMDYGWTIYKGTFINLKFIERINGSWCVPMIHATGLTKHVPLDSFNLPVLVNANTNELNVLDMEFYALLSQSMELFEKGVYEYERIQQTNKTYGDVKETEGVVEISMPGYSSVRVFQHMHSVV